MGKSLTELMSASISNAIVAQRAWDGIIVLANNYGAEPGKDSTAAIQKAINDAKEKGKSEVYFQPGAYSYTSLSGTDGIVFVGDGVTVTGGTPTIPVVSTAQLADIAINVKSFGAKGDGITDDTQAFKDCLEYCILNNFDMYIPEGTYIVTTFGTVRLKKRGLRIFGSGRKSVIKRKDGFITADHQVIFRFWPETGVHVEQIIIENLAVDSNARGNPLPPGSDSYIWEHCADFAFSGNDENSRILSVTVKDVYATDPVADHLWLAGLTRCFVDTVNIVNFTADGRNRTRSDITITGKPATFNANNITVDRLEMEINSNDSYECVLNITNARCGMMELTAAGATTDHADAVTVQLTNCYTQSFLFGDIRLKAVNCTFADDGNTRLLALQDSSFTSCDFICTSVEETLTTPFLSIEYGRKNVEFNGCYFGFEDETISRSGSTSWIRSFNTGMNDTSNPESNVIVRNCIFGVGREYSIELARAGYLKAENSEYRTVTAFSYYGASNTASLSSRLEVVGGHYHCEKFMHIVGAASLPDPLDWVKLRGVVLDYSVTDTIFSNSNSSWTNLAFLVTDLTVIDDDPPPSNIPRFLGTKWKLRDYAETKPTEWLSRLHGSGGSNSWSVVSQCRGTTAQRPSSTDIASNYMQYFDTTLGKPIYWNGTGWVDSTGTNV